MTRTLTSILVGSHFVPPAKIIIEHLPSGTPLSLTPDPENPYDEHAIRVSVAGSAIPASQHDELAVKLPGAGQDLESVIAPGANWPLGHVGSSEGKPLVKARLVRADLVGNKDFLEIMQSGVRWTASLGFDGSGMSLVVMEVENVGDNELTGIGMGLDKYGSMNE